MEYEKKDGKLKRKKLTNINLNCFLFVYIGLLERFSMARKKVFINRDIFEINIELNFISTFLNIIHLTLSGLIVQIRCYAIGKRLLNKLLLL